MSKSKHSRPTGFSYTIETEKIRAYMQLSTMEKLLWLDAITKLNQAVYSEKDWETIRKLKG